MSDILARIRVRETHGIRRFLYPLTVYVDLPMGTDISLLQLAPLGDIPVPSQVMLWHTGQYRVDFAVSMAPLQEDIELILRQGGPQAEVPDPLHLIQLEDGKLQSQQGRFSVTLGSMGEICNVIYDEVEHLTKPEFRVDYPAAFRRPDIEDKQYKRGLIAYNAAPRMLPTTMEVDTEGGPLAAWHHTKGVYADGSPVEVTTQITACKSWVTLDYRLEQPRLGEVIYFYLPLGGEFDVSPIERTIFDCGINGIYGQADYYGAYLNWFASKTGDDLIHWEIGKSYEYSNGHTSPVNYTGTTSEEKFQGQRWFHLVNGTQAVAVAVTEMPVGWRSLKVQMRHNISIEFELSKEAAGPAEIGICCHFLNDVPAIAAATNPQSILLPPIVEVLPVG